MKISAETRNSLEGVRKEVVATRTFFPKDDYTLGFNYLKGNGFFQVYRHD